MAEMVPESLVHSPFNHLMQLLAQKVSMNWLVKGLHYIQVDLGEGWCKKAFYITQHANLWLLQITVNCQ